MAYPYDYLIVGSGLFGATFAHFAHKRGARCLVIDKRPHLGGNVYCQDVEGIHVHQYGAHIFHTSNKRVWDFVNSIVPFNRYTNSPVANYQGRLYNLPFNMNTFYQMWGVVTPEEAAAKIEEQRAEALAKMRAEGATEPRNLEEQALALIGRDIYERLIKGYTEKQWGRQCTELPAFIIKRLPVRLVYDNNYFNDLYQGIPVGGYNRLIDGLLEGVDTRTNTDFFDDRAHWEQMAPTIVYTGQLDEFFEYRYGHLNFRPHHRAQALRAVRPAGLRQPPHRHQSRVQHRVAARHGALLSRQRRGQQRPGRPLPRLGRHPLTLRHLRWPPRRIQILRHGPHHRKGHGDVGVSDNFIK